MDKIKYIFKHYTALGSFDKSVKLRDIITFHQPTDLSIDDIYIQLNEYLSELPFETINDYLLSLKDIVGDRISIKIEDNNYMVYIAINNDIDIIKSEISQAELRCPYKFEIINKDFLLEVKIPFNKNTHKKDSSSLLSRMFDDNYINTKERAHRSAIDKINETQKRLEKLLES